MIPLYVVSTGMETWGQDAHGADLTCIGVACRYTWCPIGWFTPHPLNDIPVRFREQNDTRGSMADHTLPSTNMQKATPAIAYAEKSPDTIALPTDPWRLARRRSRAIDVAIMALIFIVAIVTYFSGIEETSFHQDESRWINRAHYLGDLADPFGPTWNDQYLTRGQPPVGSYMMGLGLVLQGRDLDTNKAYDFRRTREFNQQLGTLPAEEDLLAGRRWNSFLGAVSASLVYLIVRQLTNPVGGTIAALFLIANPLQTWHNRLALADTTLTLTLALLMLAVIQLMRRPSWGWAIAAGVLIGIGGANKFTPLALMAPLALIGAVMLIRGWLDRRALRGSITPGFLGFPSFRDLGWMLVSIPFTALATFVLIYPYLWPDPIGRTLTLIEFRQDEMANQYRLYPQFRTDTPLDALERTVVALGDSWSSTGHFLESIGLNTLAANISQLDVILAVTGVAILLWLGIHKGIRSAELAVVSLIIFQTATIVLNMRVDFERYYLPILLGEVVAIGSIVGVAVALVRQAFFRPVQAPATARTVTE